MDESELDESRVGRKQGWTKTGWTKMNWTKSGSTGKHTIHKLLKSSLPKILVRTIFYMLKNTVADVYFNNGKGETWKIKKGHVKEM